MNSVVCFDLINKIKTSIYIFCFLHYLFARKLAKDKVNYLYEQFIKLIFCLIPERI